MSKIAIFIAIPLLLLFLIATMVSGLLGMGGDAGVSACTPTRPAELRSSGITEEMFGNAATIVRVGQQMRVPQRGWVIAVATAMQESSLINTPDGDRDSVGLFQQRPSQGWGSAEQLHDPVYASQQFYKALLKIPEWEQLPLTVAAQRVERSAYPDAYAKHEAIAARIVTAIATAVCAAAGPFGQRVVEFASRWIGKAGYDWGAGDFHGPTGGNFDCSGLTLYAVYQASGGRIRLPHGASRQISHGTTVSRVQAAPGDLIFFHDRGDSSSYYHHVGVYLGQGMMIHAPDYGQLVQKSRVFGVKYWESQDIRFVRYG